uniref:Uncharacterized protein n=1 Tax=Desertifilum tharense IPPAS B-1220 TaxID=1781255 RepID=A0ACD5GSA8_9CYAN
MRSPRSYRNCAIRRTGYQWRGHTLAINSGATMTELVLVDLPNQHQKLTHPDFKLRSFAYGDQAIDQDIISQLFLPQAEETLCEDLNIPLESWYQRLEKLT